MPPEDLEERGRAIFESLRATPEPEAEPSDSVEDVAGAEVEAAAPIATEPVDTPPDALPADEPEIEPEPREPESDVAHDSPSETEAPEAPSPTGLRQPIPGPGLSDEELESFSAETAQQDPVPEAANGDAPSQPAPAPQFRSATVRELPRILAIANQKGGVGKTTTAVNLSAALAELGHRVLVIDLDPQGNATTGLGVNPRNLEHTVYDVLTQETPLEDCIEPTSVRNLFVVPATIDLAGAEIELVPAFSRELRLRKAIEALDGEFDYTVIDCPPSLGLITVNGLAAATEVVVPIQCEYYALEGLGQLLRNVSLVQSNLNPALEVSAIVLTMYDARTKLSDQVAAEVRSHFGDKVCRNIVPRTVRLSEAPSFGQPITVFDPSSRGAIAYRELAKEVSGGAS
jgi:chromosome partitioning protein